MMLRERRLGLGKRRQWEIVVLSSGTVSRQCSAVASSWTFEV